MQIKEMPHGYKLIKSRKSLAGLDHSDSLEIKMRKT